jgi:hypothetical protein
MAATFFIAAAAAPPAPSSATIARVSRSLSDFNSVTIFDVSKFHSFYVRLIVSSAQSTLQMRS